MRAFLFFSALLFTAVNMAQNPGDLDSTFSEDGKLVLDTLSIGTGLVKVASTADGKLLVAILDVEPSDSSVHLMRLEDSGALDTTFGTGGYVHLYHSSGSDALVDLLIQSDGRIILLGRFNGLASLLRFDSNGIPDSTYGDAGVLVIPDDFGTVFCTGSAIYDDDAIILCGNYTDVSDLHGYFLMKLKSNAILDDSFNSVGHLLIPGFHSESSSYLSADAVSDVDIMADGSIVAAVNHYDSNSHYGGIVRMRHFSFSGAVVGPNWAPPGLHNYDPVAFRICTNHLGAAVMGHEGHLADIVRQSWLWAAGVQPAVDARCTWSSCYEPGWNNELTTQQADQTGNFLVAGNDGASNAWILGRLLPSGVRDTTFGQPFYCYNPSTPFDHHTETIFEADQDARCSDVGIQLNGKVVMAGRSAINGVQRPVLARYHNIPDPRAQLDLRVYLGGTFDSTTLLMRDDLRTAGLLPTQQPYTAMGSTAVNGTGPWAMPASVLSIAGPDAIVDWLWLELLSATDTSTVLSTRGALLHRDGRVTQANGHSSVDFDLGAGTYFLRVKHRNHLAITCADPVTLGNTALTVDLIAPASTTFGTDATMVQGGLRMLWPGDATGDGVVKYMGAGNDRDAILVAIGGTPPTATATGYLNTDVNMDGIAKYHGPDNDRDVILQTIGAVPTAVRIAQAP
ncbi:MAG: hypothetical protein ABI432_16615 [Flavobacteriales bacterium]